ncbi:MAG: LPXTG cell wall anchor domain-containing protein [Chloroflexota bacterium]
MRKIITVGILALLLQALAIGSTFAQDFGSLVAQANTANETWVSQINQGLAATDLATLQADAATALTTGQQVQSLLQAALPLAPDDASRSRVQGVLTHVTAALQSGKQVSSAKDLDTAHSALNAERGEAQEALNELAPFAGQTAPAAAAPAATTLPQTGGAPVTAVALGGLAVLVTGLGMRRRLA